MAFRQKALELVNAYRSRHQSQALVVSKKIEAIAERHSSILASKAKMPRVNPKSQKLKISENIYFVRSRKPFSLSVEACEGR